MRNLARVGSIRAPANVGEPVYRARVHSAGGLAVRAAGLTKSYRIGVSGERPTTAAEAIAKRIRHPMQRLRHTTFDALHNVSFDIEWGQAVGIVGRNGAGKSTLLKLLTRITAPSGGRIELGGRIGSLLEVGTGFHPELTGRENIFLNGALLGMTRREIRHRFDDIVEFSGVANFLETPVKRYSSGMYVRLAFAVAAHLETEILAIDEVLAVGDAEFQARSLAKMREVARDGRTVLFVSHQVATVSALCTKALYLDRGRLTFSGDVAQALQVYRDSFESFAAAQRDEDSRPGTGEIRLVAVEATASYFEPDGAKEIVIHLGRNPVMVGDYFVSCHINDVNGAVIAQCDSRLVGGWFDPMDEHKVTLRMSTPWLKPGRYTVDVYVCRSGVLDAWEGAAVFEVLPHNPYPQLVGDEATAAGIALSEFAYERL
jgi:lipopolysaccharide transport system ATP-binding protein